MSKLRHGGKREGAGRKGRFNEPTVTMRVPQSCVPTVNDMLTNMAAVRTSNHDIIEIMRPSEGPWRIKRPLFSSFVPAGFPSPADDYVETRLDLNEHFVTHPAATFFVRVQGDSMNKAGIFPGALLSVDRSLDPVSGDIVLAVVNNELTVKRLYMNGGTVELRPESDNLAHTPITFQDGDDLTVWGVVNGVHLKMR